MSANLRQEKVQNTSAPVKENVRTKNSLLRFKWIAGITVYSLLVLTPFIFGLRPVTEYLGMVSQENMYSRIEFQWKVPDKEAIYQEIEKTHYPIYERVARTAWLAEVFNPVSKLLEQAIDLRNPEALAKYAETEKIKLSPQEAEIITNYVLREMNGGLYAEVVSPAMRAIDQWVYSRGVMSDERYEQELKSPSHSIEIIDPANRFASGDIVGITPNDGPISTKKVPEILEKAFYEKLFLLRSALRHTLIDIIARRIQNHPTLLYEEKLTKDILERRKELALKKASHISLGEPLLLRNQVVTPLIYGKLRTENEEYIRSLDTKRQDGEVFGKFVLTLILMIFFVAAMLRINKQRGIFGVAISAVPVIVTMYLLIFNGISLTALPAGLLFGFAALGAGSIAGILATAAFCGLAYITCTLQSGALLGMMVSGVVFAMIAPKQRFRMGLAKCSIIAGIVGGITFLCWQLGIGQELIVPDKASDFLSLEGGANQVVQSVWLFCSWLVAFILLIIAMPVLQPLFGVTSNLRLQDLQEHPLLNKLLVQAPSTYYHSSVVSALAETAAQAVGANALLCKIACLYHDIGKLVKPQYFTENESGISRHDSLTPQMSALIIISHVKDGVEMAKQWHLPQAITDIVEQHHGKTLVSYFLRQAREQAEDPDEVDEELFRYPGSKPTSKEAAVCMIADSVEAASRSIDGASAARIRSLVHSIIISKLEDRQFDESGMNFTDLSRIEEALVKILTSMFHSRVKYPKDEKQQRRR